ncbi:MAG: radical SAM protein, partial [Candidatus Carbobacillus sp.]|nr:radical SAM protein [Candidatus Carbobacillus sp.]
FANKRKYSLGYITTSRGCPYNCIFCNNNLTGHRVCRYKSVDNVIKELEILICKYEQKDITFFDDNFLTSPKRTNELCKAIIEKGWQEKCDFMFQSRAKDVKEDIIAELSKAGFKTVFLGIESVSTNLLSIIGKKERIVDIENAIKIAKSAKFKVIANFLFCLPEETAFERAECVSFAIKNNIDVVKFNNIVPYPGTELYNQNYQSKINFNYPDYGNFNSQIAIIHPFYKKIPFPLIPNNSIDKQIESEIIISYLKFYFRFSVIKKIITHKKWGGLIFQFGNRNRDVIRHIPHIFVLLANLSIKVLNALIFNLFHKKKLK